MVITVVTSFFHISEPIVHRLIRRNPRTTFPSFHVVFETYTPNEVATLAAEAEKKKPEDRTERERIAIMGKPRLGPTNRAQIRIKESKEFKK
ncbi:unnamed protein product [Acanthoscelides obtectus]|uniref:Uncharacterized protein n=1 Tax=Acanthoscelides obtectus TaxID=200917 RepID=A0A9P0KCC9_ACAOB|nr:unnamed protein product [Acanthoscelides obtectus]CAK1657592.1 hypothetical protein AOBTE_LOCUS20435 [Acanthoscelides obtectus]